MGYQKTGGCSCNSGRTMPQSKCGANNEPVVQPCLTPIEGACATDLNIVQGEDMTQTICFSGAMSGVRCLNADGSISTTDSMGNPKKVRLACTGSDWQFLAGVYQVAASDPAKKTLTLNGLDVPTTKCFESVMKNIPGCKSTVSTQTPPTVIEHVDATDWVFEGRIYTRRSTTGSKKTFGVYPSTNSDTIYYTIDRDVHVGDSVCVYLPSQTVKAKVLRVSCDEIVDECGDTVKATFLELDQQMPAVADGVCVAMSVDAGVLLDIDASITAAGCVQISIPWTATRDLPFIEHCDEPKRKPDCDPEEKRFLGYWDLFATMSYTNSAGQLETMRKRVSCGCVYVHPSSAGIYTNCQ